MKILNSQSDTYLISKALKDAINRAEEIKLDQPYLIVKCQGKTKYTLREILSEIENDTPFGRDMVYGMVRLTVDLLSKEKINL